MTAAYIGTREQVRAAHDAGVVWDGASVRSVVCGPITWQRSLDGLWRGEWSIR